MHTFKCRLSFAKSTDAKLRWDEDVDGTLFELYIPKWRVPEHPVPQEISVQMWMIPKAISVGVLPPSSSALLKAGVDFSEIGPLQELLPIVCGPVEYPITSVVHIDRVHTETVRYNPLGDPKKWEIGQPYVPQSVLGFPYPEQLVLQVKWLAPS
jgi:hypothetical protein